MIIACWKESRTTLDGKSVSLETVISVDQRSGLETVETSHFQGSGPEWYISSMIYIVEIYHSGLEHINFKFY